MLWTKFPESGSDMKWIRIHAFRKHQIQVLDDQQLKK
jgi:hypothetical protein